MSKRQLNYVPVSEDVLPSMKGSGLASQSKGLNTKKKPHLQVLLFEIIVVFGQ